MAKMCLVFYVVWKPVVMVQQRERQSRMMGRTTEKWFRLLGRKCHAWSKKPDPYVTFKIKPQGSRLKMRKGLDLGRDKPHADSVIMVQFLLWLCGVICLIG